MNGKPARTLAPAYLLVAAALLAALALGAALWILAVKLTEEETMTGQGLIVMPRSLGGPFALTDHRGNLVTEKAFAGRYTLVYFGYSFCPDICPTSLQTMAAAMDAVPAGKVGGAFVTVDPERDTADQLASYVPLFHERLDGLTGTPAAIGRLAGSFRVYYQLRKDIDPEAYPVDHSSYIYLMDPDWRLVAVFRPDASVGDIAAAVRRLL